MSVRTFKHNSPVLVEGQNFLTFAGYQFMPWSMRIKRLL